MNPHPEAASKFSYRLFGDFWLEEPEKHLSQEAPKRLRELIRDEEIQSQQGRLLIYLKTRVLSNPSSAARLGMASVQY